MGLVAPSPVAQICRKPRRTKFTVFFCMRKTLGKILLKNTEKPPFSGWNPSPFFSLRSGDKTNLYKLFAWFFLTRHRAAPDPLTGRLVRLVYPEDFGIQDGFKTVESLQVHLVMFILSDRLPVFVKAVGVSHPGLKSVHTRCRFLHVCVYACTYVCVLCHHFNFNMAPEASGRAVFRKQNDKVYLVDFSPN